jgi:CRISPR system Cascade subunit CasB
VEEVSHHLRGLIQLLKAGNIPLDYPSLAEDLYQFQFPEMKDSVRLQWGRQFYRIRDNEETKDDKK